MCVASPPSRCRSLRTRPGDCQPMSITGRTEPGGASITRYSIGSIVWPLTSFVDHARLADRQLEAFAAHVLDQDAQVQQAAAGDVELVALDLVGTTRRATFDSSSFISRSRSCRLVTYVPSWPANGESLMRKTMSSVGSSTLIGGSGTGFSMSAIVSPMSTSPGRRRRRCRRRRPRRSRCGQGGRRCRAGRPCRRSAAPSLLQQGDALVLADLAGDDPADGDAADVVAVVERRRPASAAARPARPRAAARASGSRRTAAAGPFGGRPGRSWRCPAGRRRRSSGSRAWRRRRPARRTGRRRR